MAVHLEKGEEFAGAFPGKRGVEAIETTDKFEEFGAGEVIKEQGIVGDEADLLFDGEGVGGHAEAEQFDFAGGGGRQAHQHFDGGGFAGSVRAEEAEETASGNGEGEAVDRRFGSIDFPEVANGDGRRGDKRRGLNHNQQFKTFRRAAEKEYETTLL